MLSDLIILEVLPDHAPTPVPEQHLARESRVTVGDLTLRMNSRVSLSEMMSVDRNKAAIRRFVAEVRNKGNVDVLDELAAPHVRNEMKVVARGLRAAFDTYEVEVVDLVGEGDTVVLRGIQRGVHRGEWLGVPATGRTVTWMVLRMFRFGADGRIVQTWAFSDTRRLIEQMGARITACLIPRCG